MFWSKGVDITWTCYDFHASFFLLFLSLHECACIIELNKLVEEKWIRSSALYSSGILFAMFSSAEIKTYFSGVFEPSWFTTEPRSEKTGLRGFRPGRTQTGLHSHRR